MTTDTSWHFIEEVFHSSLYNFFSDLNVAAAGPEDQCELGQYFNVAWELKDDLSRHGEDICNSPASLLSEVQKEAVLGLMAELGKIPDYVLVADKTRDGNIAAMKHPVWDDVRIRAAKVNQLLGPLKQQNAGFFKRDSQ